MSIVTAADVFDLAGMSGNIASIQADIDRLIPITENWLVNYLRQYFICRNYHTSSNITFTATALTDTEAQFLDADVNFRDGMSFLVIGSIRNDGVYAAADSSGVAAGTITLDDKYNFVAEDFTPSPAVTIYEIDWPEYLKIAVAKAIEYDLGKTRSVVEAPTRQNAGDADKRFRYPRRILDMFGPRALC